MALGAFIVVDLAVYLAWAVLYVIFASMEPTNVLYAIYTRIHASYVTHSFATIRMLTIWERNYASSTLMPYTTGLILTFALVLDTFNVVHTHQTLPHTIEWAWVAELVLAYGFLGASVLYFIAWRLVVPSSQTAMVRPKHSAMYASVRTQI
jgi:hypothetical protein